MMSKVPNVGDKAIVDDNEVRVIRIIKNNQNEPVVCWGMHETVIGACIPSLWGEWLERKQSRT